jgi:hypothetical protein
MNYTTYKKIFFSCLLVGLSSLPLHASNPFPSTLVEAIDNSETYDRSLLERLHELKEKNSYSHYIQDEWNGFAEQLLHKNYLQFSGFYPHSIDSGCTPYGEELHDKVRVSLINGMLNARSDLSVLLKIFSITHGNIPIHYVYRPTEGWTKDLLTSTLSKLGFTSSYAKLLAETWKELIKDMGGVGEGGIIIHYAHSIGATDTFIAKNLLTLEEQQMIHVITLGSPTVIPHDCGFGSAINYASRRDGVCFLDPIGYSMGYFFETSKIEFIGTHWGIPLIDHTLYTESYGAVIEQLGSQFVQIHGNER